MAGRAPLLLCALALLRAAAPHSGRCSYDAAGDLVGHEVYVNRSTLQPAAARRYTHPVPRLPGCVVNGVSARACDLFAPEVEVCGEQAGEQGARVEVRRLGPRLRPVTLELWLYCDPAPAATAPATAPATTPASELVLSSGELSNV